MNVFPLYYFPPVPWFAAAIQESQLLLDIQQPYRKQRYFSRTIIQGANQTLPLVIPVERRSKRIALAQKQISYAENWQTQHWRSIVFSYKNSPYFEFYQDQLHPLFHHPVSGLTDLLLHGLTLTFQLLQHPIRFSTTTTYLPASAYDYDYRKDFNPPMNELPSWYQQVSYPQVFGDFRAEVSILDLLFNMGPESKQVLEHSFKKIVGL